MKDKDKNKRNIWKMVSIVSLIGCILCVCYVGWYYFSRYQAELEYQKVKEETRERTTDSLEDIENSEFVGIVDGEEPVLPKDVLTDLEDHPVNFDKLQEYNEELYAWIRIPNTKIDYPVAQYAGEDQSFYLKHNMYKEPQFAGCIYTEKSNNKDFNDPNTVFYGHNMKNGSMFQNLFKFRDKDFFEENKYVYIYTPDKIRVYEVFTSYDYDDRNIMNSFDFSDQKVYEDYLKEIQQPRSMSALMRDDVKLSADSKIITLSTCIAWQTDARFLVQAVLVFEEDAK